MSDKICSSADKVLEVFLENAPMDTSHHRMVKQQNKCGYGLQGVCCRLCSNGPCRLSPAKPKGVCGADADTIACRNFLRQVAAGSGCYTHIVENTARRLKEMAQEFIKMGYYIGVGGVVTFKNAKKLKETVQEIPLDRILLETDCPYMAPEPHRGERNDSSYIPFVIKKIAELRGITPEEVEQATRANAERLFRNKDIIYKKE